jgi:TPR repeat protein
LLQFSITEVCFTGSEVRELCCGAGEAGDLQMSNHEEIMHYTNLAETGDATAQCWLGWVYQNGQGVPQDDAEALKWYHKAAVQGNTDAQNNLGTMYRNGHGVPQNNVEAVMWYVTAAGLGNSTAQINLGVMYQNGKGVPQSDAEAVKWYRKAAEQGNAYAQNCLGLMYQDGKGVPKNDAEAVKWFQKAAAQGNTNTQKILDQIKAKGIKVDTAESKPLVTQELAAQNFPNQEQSKTHWLYADKGINKGPVETAELKKLLQIGEINLKTLLWQEGMATWQPLDEVEELNH